MQNEMTLRLYKQEKTLELVTEFKSAIIPEIESMIVFENVVYVVIGQRYEIDPTTKTLVVNIFSEYNASVR